MKIKILEERIRLNVGGSLREYSAGDEVTIDDEIGLICCRNGWAKDIDGNVETAERKPGANGPIEPESVSQKISE